MSNDKLKQLLTKKNYKITELIPTSGSSSPTKYRNFEIIFTKNPSKSSSSIQDFVEEDEYDSNDDDDYEEEDDSSNTENSESEDEDSSVSSIDTDEALDCEIDDKIEEQIEDTIKNDIYIKQMNKEYKKSKSKHLKELIDACKNKIRENVIKEHAKNIKLKDKYSRIFKKKIAKNNNKMDTLEYYDENYSASEKYDLIKKMNEVNEVNIINKPYRIKILESDIPVIFKAHAIKKINALKHMDPSNGEYSKLKYWIDNFMRIPFNNYVSLPVYITDGLEKCNDFMENAQKTLDIAVYGLNDTKMQIMQLLGQLISNPHSTGISIGIHGDKGIGKTSIVKDGISKILNRPFAFIPLGGATESSYLEGHSYTYEGSSWGKIVQILLDCQTMNPVIFFDELDKISDTPKGEEIASILTHLTDATQNSEFHDKYFTELKFDLSKCIFIFSYNDETKINPILKDRMYTIHAKGYDKKEKVVIAKQYLLSKIIKEINFNETDIILPDDIIGYIIDKYCNSESGVRGLKRCLEIIYTKLNLYRLIKPGTKMFDNNITMELVFPVTITKQLVDKFITIKDIQNQSLKMMYI
jgi:ATP-dependent Lon protease